MKHRIRPVDEHYTTTRRVYALALDEHDFAHDVVNLDLAGYTVINGDEDRLLDEVDLRVHLQGLSVADDLMLPDIWWTSARAHQLVMVAGWMGVRFINQHGSPIETVSARS